MQKRGLPIFETSRYALAKLTLVAVTVCCSLAWGQPPPIRINDLTTTNSIPTVSGTSSVVPTGLNNFEIVVNQGDPATFVNDSNQASADFQIFSIDPATNADGHGFAWRMTLADLNAPTAGARIDLLCTITATDVDGQDTAVLTIIDVSGQPQLEAAPLSRTFLPQETDGLVAEVFNTGAGFTNWSARLIPGRNWGEDEGSLTLTPPMIDDIAMAETFSGSSGAAIGTVEISLGAGVDGNTTPFDRHATIEIFPVNDLGVRINPGTDPDNRPVNQPVFVEVIHLKVFDTLDTSLEVPDDNLRFLSGHVRENYFSYDPLAPAPVTQGALPATDDGEVQLVAAAFGHPVGFSPASLNATVNDRLFNSQDGPFRFNTILFGQDTLDDTTDATGFVEDNGLSDFENAQNRIAQLQFNRDQFLAELFTTDDRDSLELLQEVFRDLLRFNPDDRIARNALLDIAFYQTSLQVIKAKELMFRGYSQRLFPRDPLRPVISNEIEIFEESLALFDSAMDPYFKLWGEVIGFAGEESMGEPFGLLIFREEAPFRRVGDLGFDARCDPLRPVGQPADCTESFDFPGMRDLDLIYDIYNHQAQAAVEVLRMRGLRLSTIDRLRSASLIRRFENRVTPEFELVSQVIPDWRTFLTPSAHTAALYTGALTGFQQVALMKGFLEGGRNVLGFDKDFLLLVQAFSSVGDEIFDTFNQILQFNNPFNAFVTPLGLAQQKLIDARASYFNYRGQEDELSETFRVQNLAIRDRLRQLSGVDPGPDIDNPVGQYLTPLDNPGGDLNRQGLSIELADIRLDITNAEGDVLLNNIENQIQTAARTAEISGDIQDVIVQRGLDRMGFQIGIGAANGISTFAQGVSDATLASDSSPNATSRSACRKHHCRYS